MSTPSLVSILPFNAEKIKDKYLVSNMMGCWDALDDEEFRLFHSLRVLEGGPLFDRLLGKGLIVSEENMRSVMDGFRRMNANLFTDAGLHIAVVTKRCNLCCDYCQAQGGISSEDMSIDTASRVLQYLFDVRNNSVTLEFQGGEPLLNWPVVRFLTENARKFNTLGKNLSIVLVTNLLLMDDEKMRFLMDHNVDVCTSLDGPAEIHDKNRLDASGTPTHAQLTEKINYISRKFGRRVHMLPTITKDSLAYPERIIDEYLRLGQPEIPLRPVNKIGRAAVHWEKIGYSAEEFNDFYDRALAYMMKLNRSGTFVSDRIARIILTKVFLKEDPSYVDMMNPCGAGRGVIVYGVDGSCYPTDEARMLDGEMFKLGNIRDVDYDKMLNNENLLSLLGAGCSILWNYRSVFSPWMGIDPVVNYAMEGNIIPKGNARCMTISKHQFRRLFSYLLEGKDEEILKRWIMSKPCEEAAV